MSGTIIGRIHLESVITDCATAAHGNDTDQKAKVFFSEEKKQKTFGPLCVRFAGPARHVQKFFGSFFQK
jgi:hypothetical protein